MRMFEGVSQVYLHRQPVDFRKSINGLSLIVEQEMKLSPFCEALYLFCNRRRDKIKILYWDKSGFCLWYKRLETEKFKWPRKLADDVINLTSEQLHWLLSGYDITLMKPHQILRYQRLT